MHKREEHEKQGKKEKRIKQRATPQEVHSESKKKEQETRIKPEKVLAFLVPVCASTPPRIVEFKL